MCPIWAAKENKRFLNEPSYTMVWDRMWWLKEK